MAKFNYNRLMSVACIAATFLNTSAAFGNELSSARSLALGGAMTALANGVDATRYSPANLGLNTHTPFQLELVSVGLNISNNSFTLDDYNQYSGAILSTSDKSDILGKIPKEGLNLKADAHAAALSIALGKFAFSISGVGAADANLNRDIIELLFNGNTFADSVIVTGSYSDAIAYAEAGLSYGHSLYEAGERQLSVGATVKYLHGFGVEEIIKLNGLASTLSTGFQGNGELVARTASGGSGYGLDLGAALKFNRSYTAGARLKNVLGSIKWNNDPKEHGYNFSFDTLTVNNANDSVIVSDDYSKDISAFTTRLATVLNLGVANTSGKMRWAIDWEQGFKRTAESSTKPRLSMGIEWLQLGMMPLRLGFSSGGDRNTSFSFGSGLNFQPFYLDFAAVTGTSMTVYSAKGVKLALSTGVRF